MVKGADLFFELISVGYKAGGHGKRLPSERESGMHGDFLLRQARRKDCHKESVSAARGLNV